MRAFIKQGLRTNGWRLCLRDEAEPRETLNKMGDRKGKAFSHIKRQSRA